MFFSVVSLGLVLKSERNFINEFAHAVGRALEGHSHLAAQIFLLSFQENCLGIQTTMLACFPTTSKRASKGSNGPETNC